MWLRTLFVASTLFSVVGYAQADCANPTAVQAAVFYNTTVNAVQFCDGNTWVNTGLKVPTATGTSCTNPSADEGSVYYNTVVNNIQFCNGDDWVNMGTVDNTSATGTACTNPVGPEGSMFFNTSYNRLQFCNGDDWVNATYFPSWWFSQAFKLLASDGAADDYFGSSVSISGDKALISADFDDDNGIDSGSAYIFDVSTGMQLHKLLPDDGAAGDNFGYSVSISGDKAIVSTYADNDNGFNSGSAYIFDVSTGTQLHKLLPDDGAASDNFGHSVSISGDKAIVGTRGDDDNGSNSGSAYIFDVATGAQLYKLLPDDGAAGDYFGWRVSISGDKAIVSARYDDDNGTDSGSAYIFDVATGVQLHKLLPDDGAAGDNFGWSVSISGGKALIGAYHDDDNGTDSGSAYIFDVNTGTQLYKLTASDAATGYMFGSSVSINGDKAIVSTYADGDNGTDSGSAYIFDVATGAQLHKLLPDDGAAGFGSSVSISGGKAVVGAYFDADNGSYSGSAYIFE